MENRGTARWPTALPAHADYAGRHLREEGAIRRLAGENRTLAEWVRETIRALARSIREKLGRPEPTLEHAQRLWERAFRAAEQHASRQNTLGPLPRPETPARYSIREEIDSSHSEEYTGENAGKENSKPKQKKNPTKIESEVWKNLDKVKGQDRKTSGTGKNKKYYEWDHTHDDIEVYDRRGNHLGSMDPVTGEMYKPAVPGRTIKID